MRGGGGVGIDALVVRAVLELSRPDALCAYVKYVIPGAKAPVPRGVSKKRKPLPNTSLVAVLCSIICGMDQMGVSLTTPNTYNSARISARPIYFEQAQGVGLSHGFNTAYY